MSDNYRPDLTLDLPDGCRFLAGDVTVDPTSDPPALARSPRDESVGS
jgi:hypothetical protein